MCLINKIKKKNPFFLHKDFAMLIRKEELLWVYLFIFGYNKELVIFKTSAMLLPKMCGGAMPVGWGTGPRN